MSMYGNSNMVHQGSLYMTQGHIQDADLADHYGQSYSNDANGSYNPIIVGVSSQYQMGHSSGIPSLQKSLKAGGGNPEEILPHLRGKHSLSPTSSADAQDSDSSAEPARKKCKNGTDKGRRSSGRGGRHQDEIRTIYKYENGQWLCPKCNKAVSPRATRMKAHFEKCVSGSSSMASMAQDIKVGNPSSSVSLKKAPEPSVEDSSDDSGTIGGRPNVGKKNNLSFGKRVEGVGRQKSEVWQFYEERDEGQFFCKRCGKRVSSKAHRLSQHLATACVDTPRYIASELRKAGLSSVTTPSFKSPVDDTRQHFDFRDGQWSCTKCGKIVSSSVEKMKKHLEVWCSVTGSLAGAVSTATSTPNSFMKSGNVRSDIGMINLQLGKFIYSSNLPFEVVEDPQFAKFVKMLRASHKLPTPADLGNSILKDVETEIQLEMKGNLSDKTVTLIQTGWSRVTDTGKMDTPDSHTIIHALHNGKCSYFLNATQTSQDMITPEYCVKLITGAIDSASNLYSCSIVGILTDHCKASVKFRDHIQQVYPEIHVYGSFLYLLNCLGKEITDFELIASVAKVQEFFSSNRSIGIYEEFAESTVIVASDKLWNSQLLALTSFVSNHDKYIELTNSLQFTIDEDIRAVIENQDILTRAQDLASVLAPLSDAFYKLHDDTATIADAVNCWLVLMNDPLISNLHKDKIQMTFNEVVTPMAIAAYLLHPVYRGQNMLSELQEIGRMWLLERNPMFVVGQTALERADTTYFPSSFLNLVVAKQMAPAVWWENAGKWPAIPEGLMNLAISLMVLPASTSTVDQCCNAIGNIMSTHKKKLGLEKALKLCNAYFSLRIK